MQGSGEISPNLAIDADYLQSLLQYSSDLVSVIEADGTLHYASPSHESILGYAPDQLAGQNMLDFVHRQDLQQVTNTLALVLAEPGATASATFRFRHGDGSWRWLESTGRNLIDDPRVAGIVANSRDVTQRVQAEGALRELYSELELRVQQRTAALEGANATLRAEAARLEQVQAEIEQSHRRESVLNSLLRISMEELSLTQQLERALDQILSIPWLPVLPKGAIFLVGEDRETLDLKVSQGLGRAFQTACARVDFGRCLCGQAAASAKVQFASSIDERHQIRYEGMEPHGHYCVPILSSHKTIGALVLYLDEGHQQDADEQNFLEAVVHTLAGIIERKWGEEALRDSERRYRLLAENATDMISRHTPQGIYLYASPVCQSLLGYAPKDLVGHDAYEFFHPDDLDAIRESHATIMDGPTIYTSAYRIRRKDGSYVWVETTSKTVRDPETGQVEEIIAITRDITQRRQAEEAVQASEQQLRRLYAQLEDHSRTLEQKVAARTREIQQRRQVAESLRGMLTVLNSELPLDEVLDHIVLEARQILGSDTSAIYQLQPRGTLVARTIQGSPQVAINDLGSLPVVSEALRAGQPVTVPDVTALPTFSTGPADPECGPAGCGALLAVPLIIKSELYGSLALYYSDPRSISDEEIHLAVAFADQAALAIENARLREQATEAAILEERARLARELHDSVTQALFSMTLLAEAGQRLAGAGDLERVQTYLSRLGDTSQQSLKEMRLLVYELRPLALESAGLLGALQQRLDAVEARAGVEARLLIEGTVQVPAAMEEDLYRIAEQALNNALKHAAATAVTVRIQCTEKQIAIEVADNGCGFSPTAIEDKGGQGLKSMRERANRLGGKLVVASAPGQGTSVRVEVEIPEKARASGDR